MRRRGGVPRGSLALALGVAIGAALLGPLPIPVRAQSSGPAGLAPGAWFAFDYDIYLTNGFGNYSGFTDQTIEHYRYTIESVVGDNVTMFGHGTWTYSNSSGGGLNGGWTETFSFSSATRLYLWGFDVNGSYSDPSVWFWIPPSQAVGDQVRILDANYSVLSLGADVWYGTPPVPHTGIHVDASGNDVRSDDYGTFNAHWVDDYWFDPTTGLLIAEFYTEHDSNSLGDGFEWQEQATVTGSSYPIPIDWVVVVGLYGGLPAVVVGAVGTSVWYRRGPRGVRLQNPYGETRVRVRRVGRPARYASLPVASSSQYAEFLPLLVRRASLRRNPVWVATDSGHLVGAMVRDREAKVATLYTRDPKLARLFRSMHRAPSFFAEIPPAGWRPAAEVAETFQLLELRPVPFSREDTSAVRPMYPADLEDVLRLAQDVYWIPEPRWMQQALDDGDLGFTALSDEAFAGFAFATVEGAAAILHSLTVAPGSRGLGIGRALTVARLNALAALGVERALVEISVHNPASLALARSLGFRPVGEVTYYARKVRKARPVERPPL